LQRVLESWAHLTSIPLLSKPRHVFGPVDPAIEALRVGWLVGYELPLLANGRHEGRGLATHDIHGQLVVREPKGPVEVVERDLVIEYGLDEAIQLREVGHAMMVVAL